MKIVPTPLMKQVELWFDVMPDDVAALVCLPGGVSMVAMPHTDEADDVPPHVQELLLCVAILKKDNLDLAQQLMRRIFDQPEPAPEA